MMASRKSRVELERAVAAVFAAAPAHAVSLDDLVEALAGRRGRVLAAANQVAHRLGWTRGPGRPVVFRDPGWAVPLPPLLRLMMAGGRRRRVKNLSGGR